jgi:hypothetical protein
LWWFRLGRRIAQSRLLIKGTYRPAEALRRTFLENVAENRELIAECAVTRQPQ